MPENPLTGKATKYQSSKALAASCLSAVFFFFLPWLLQVVQTVELPERALPQASKSQGCGHDQSDIFATQKIQKSRRSHCQPLEDEFLNYL